MKSQKYENLFTFFLFSYADCDNEQNLVQTMSRTDQTHTTFLACLRDWNDPYLHGQKPTKAIGCNRCENCGCRMLLNSDLNGSMSSKDLIMTTANVASSTSVLDCKSHPFELHCHEPALNTVNSDYQSNTNSKLNKNQNEIVHRHLRKHSHHKSNSHEIQTLTRSKSSVNVPKTIDQCIKMAKSRPRPSSIRPHASHLSGLLINEAALPTFKRQPIALKLTQSRINLNSHEEIKNDASSPVSYSNEDTPQSMFVNKIKCLTDIERDSLEFVKSNENANESQEPYKNELEKQVELTMSCSSLSASSNPNLGNSNEIQMNNSITPDPEQVNHVNTINNEDDLKPTVNSNKRVIENQKLSDSASLFSSSTSINNANEEENNNANNNNFDDSLQDKSFDSDR